MKKGIHIMNKKNKKGYVTVLLLILYSICRSPKYKMICLKSPKSSEFAIFLTNTYSGQKSLTMFISSYCNNYLVEWLKIRKLNR